MNEILRGERIRLSALDPEEIGRAYSIWNRDSEFDRLGSSNAARLVSSKKIQEFVEKEIEEESPIKYYFSIRALDDNRLLGDIGLDVINWGARDAFVGISVGDRELWGKGYGTDAMKVLLRYAFTEVNLRRVTLTVFDYNPRAIRSYEKAGFQIEGRLRGAILKEGKRWDILYMGILQEEWTRRQTGQPCPAKSPKGER